MLNKGLQLWERAKTIIPGGNGLLSKRPERHAPDIWPTYYSRAKGVRVWDLEDTEFIDMSYMGLGTTILGYADQDVDSAVKAAIDKGVSTTLNVPEEVELAQLLLDLNSFAGSVKFARSGGEAMAIAIRIARAHTGKDVIAFSGYHGWCDWYLATNLTGEENLKDHLLPGLSPKGVPSGLKNTVLPFVYNDVESFRALMREHDDVGVIVIEGARYGLPCTQFIQEIVNTARNRGIVLICDEITSGWRLTDSGVYKHLGFTPDIVVYGKGMGNGYAISAVVGKSDIMQAAQETFVSSTFWTERVGFVAGLATINKFVANKVWEHLNSIGAYIGDAWESLAQKHGILLQVTAFKPLVTIKLCYRDNLNVALETLFVQEMLKRGYLASLSVYVSYSHTQDIIDVYLKEVDEVFAYIAHAVETNTVYEKLETRVKEQGFKRLN